MKKYKLLYILLLLYLLILCIQKLAKISMILSLIHVLWITLCSFVVTLLLYPFIKKFPSNMKWKTKVFIVYGILMIIFIGCIALFIPLLVQQSVEVVEQYPQVFKPYIDMLSFETLHKNFTLEKIQFTDIQPYLNFILNIVDKCTDYIFVYLLSLFISLDLMFFQSLSVWLKKRMNLLCIAYERFSIMIFQYVKATFIDLFVLGIGCFIILFFFVMDGALIYAILLAIGNLIPYIGSLVVLFMIAVISILNKGYDIWPMLLCLGLFQQIEANFIQNILFQKVMHVRPLFTFLAFYITQALMGFWWILLSPILAGFLEMFVQATLEIISNSNKMN